MDRNDIRFDTRTQSFLVNRWETELGQQVLNEIVDGIKSSVEIRAILDDYVLDHIENRNSYGHPYYPPDAIKPGEFWVLNSDDLRGVCIYNESFSGTKSLEVKMLAYASFYNCDFTEANIERSDLSFARFEKCLLIRTIFAAAGGFDTRMIDCQAHGAVFLDAGLRGWDVRGTDYTGAYFGGALLEDLQLNHLTRFDRTPNQTWGSRTMPNALVPDVLRGVRLAYERAELWSQMDDFLREEKRSERKHILWPQFRKTTSLSDFKAWCVSAISDGLSFYGTSPLRVLELHVFTVLAFGYAYWGLGTANSDSDPHIALPVALLFSFSKFASLGLAGTANMASGMESTMFVLEGLAGGMLASLFLVVLTRKLIRR